MNPYETPKSELAPPPPPMSLGAQPLYWAEGEFLVCRSGAVLPFVCLKTNEPVSRDADPRSRKKTTLFFVPPWVFLFVLLRGIGLLIAYFVFRKACNLEYSLSAETRRKHFRRGLTSVMLFVVAIVGMVSGATQFVEHPVLRGTLFGVFILSLIGAIIFAGLSIPIKVAKHRQGLFYVKGVSPDFLNAVRNPVA